MIRSWKTELHGDTGALDLPALLSLAGSGRLHMSAAVLLVGFTLFAACLMLHVVIWRIGRPRSDARALFVIFLIAPTLGGAALFGASLFALGGPVASPLDSAAVLLLHWALASAYVLTYPAAQAQSPSLEIAYAVGQSMPRGLSREEILALLSSEALVHSRVDDLIDNRLIRVDGDRYVLTVSATRLVRGFLGLRRLLGLPKRGG